MPDSERAYRRLLGRNVSGKRGRLQLSQTAVATRMRGLGFGDWHQQTVASIEKGKRRVTADELLGLAACLETTVHQLMSPPLFGEPVELTPEISLTAGQVRSLIDGHGPNDEDFPGSHVQGARDHRGIRWDDNTLEPETS